MEKKYDAFYKRHNVKHVTAFLSPDHHHKLKQLCLDADKSVTRYVSRLLEKHIEVLWEQRSEDLVKHRRHQSN